MVTARLDHARTARNKMATARRTISGYLAKHRQLDHYVALQFHQGP